MNLLEHYIKEVHSVKEYNEEWTKEFPDEKFVRVDITYDCYGSIERNFHVWNTDAWNRIKKKGYFMA